MKNEELVKQLTSPSKNSRLEKFGKTITFLCLALIVFIVAMILLFVAQKGLATFFVNKVSLIEFLFSGDWSPSEGKFGALPMILGSFVVTLLSALVATPFAIGAAIFMTEISPKGAKFLQPAIELLVGIPSVVYGLLGILIVNPMMYKLELMIYHGSKTHQFTGGANLLSAIIVLAIMILPTLINISETALKAVPDDYRKSSLALGASKMQTIFKVVVPSAKSGIMSAIVLGVGRAIGEAMAILLVAGNAVSLPLPFNSVRFLTTAIVSEMGYASGTHRQVLFTIGLVLFIFIMVINLVLTYVLKRGDLDE